MRLAGSQDPSLQLLKILLEALPPSEGGDRVEGKAKTSPETKAAAQPPTAAPTTKAHPGSPPGFNKPAPVTVEAVAAQMLAAVMAEGDTASAGAAEARGEIEGRTDAEASDAAREEPALAQARPGAGNGPIPWPNEALAAYSARPAKLGELQAGGGPARGALGGRGDAADLNLSSLKLVKKALVYASAIAVLLFVLLNREALFG